MYSACGQLAPLTKRTAHFTKCAAHMANCASLTLTLKLTQTLTLTLLQVRCAIDQILRYSSKAAQLINWSRRSAFDQTRNWPNARYRTLL